jgi:hypothetical protein
MIDGVTSAPFSATTLPPIEKPLISFKQEKREEHKKKEEVHKAKLKDEKGPKPENLSALRNALAAVIKDNSGPAESRQSQPQQPQQSKPQPIPETPRDTHNKKAKEVPEELLRSILELDA